MTLSQEIYQAVSARRPSCLLAPDTEYTPAELVDFLLHPRGIEHALATGFPSLAFLREHSDLLEGQPITLLNASSEAQTIHVSGETHLFAGEGGVSVYIDGCEEGLTTLVFLHGVRAHVFARNYAVVKIHADASTRVDAFTDNALLL